MTVPQPTSSEEYVSGEIALTNGIEGASTNATSETAADESHRQNATSEADEVEPPSISSLTIEQRRVEERVRANQSLVALAGEVAKIGGWRVSLSNAKISMSDQVCAIYGVPIGSTPTLEEISNYYASDFQEIIREAGETCVREGIPFDIEAPITRTNGQRLWVRTIGRPERNRRGEIVGLHGALQDIDYRKKLEEHVHRAQKMDAIGQLAAGVAHDFNNMLSVILGYIHFLLDDTDPQDPRHTDIQEIEKAASRAVVLTRQLLVFSRQQKLEPRVVDLTEIIVGTQKMLTRVLGESFSLAIVAQSKAKVCVDPVQLEQAIVNLVVNARDAMPQGGEVLIETRDQVIADEVAAHHANLPEGSYASISVTDTGVGMDSATSTRIFEPFFTTKGKKGTGLGLSMVYGFVTQSGGAVTVHSTPGEGSTFRILLPQATAAEPSSNNIAQTQQPKTGHETVLLVEENESLRSSVRLCLVRAGYHVLVAQNAGEALLIAEKHQSAIDLMITTRTLKLINGRELVHRIQQMRPQIHAIYVQDAGEEHSSIPNIARVTLYKPYDPDKLLNKIREVLDEKE